LWYVARLLLRESTELIVLLRRITKILLTELVATPLLLLGELIKLWLLDIVVLLLAVVRLLVVLLILIVLVVSKSGEVTLATVEILSLLLVVV